MSTRFTRSGMIGSLFAVVCIFAACGGSSSIGLVPTATATATAAPTSTPTTAPTATATVPPATPTPAPGVCNPADFPTRTSGGPIGEFQYPPLTYSVFSMGAAGNEYYTICSSGTPASIIAFLTTSMPAGGWHITSSSSTTIAALDSGHPQSGYCRSVELTVGGFPGYPSEWSADFHPPAVPC